MEELEKRRQDKAPVEVMRRAQEDKRTGVGGQLASLLKSRQCQQTYLASRFSQFVCGHGYVFCGMAADLVIGRVVVQLPDPAS